MPVQNDLGEYDWSYDSPPEGPNPYKLLGLLAFLALLFGIPAHGYYSFVDDMSPRLELVFPCLLLAIATAVALFVYAWRRDSWEPGFRQITVLALLFAPVPMAYLMYSGAGRLANVWLDFSSPQTHEAILKSKGTASTRRLNQQKPAKRLYVARMDEPVIEVPVQKEVYNRAHIGDTFLLTTKRGAFGREWIVKLEPRQ